MSLIARVRSWLRVSSRRADFEREMQDEMRTHLELYQADLRRRGVPEEEARRRALAEFGSVAARKEECRDAVGLRLLDELRGDVSYAFRLLRRSPAFTLVALLSLGLGIGANTAIFTLIDTVLVKTLPVEDPQRLFFVDNSGGKSGGSSGPPYPCFERLRDHNRFLSGIAAFDERMFKVSIDGVPERVRGQYASGSYFDLLGVRAVHGRMLTPADDSEPGRGGPHGAVAVISDGFWTRRFGRDPAVLGKSVQVGTQWVTIVGVTPPGFFGLQVGAPLDITLPMMLVEQGLQSKQSWWLSVIGRLAPGATVEAARADLEALWDAYLTEVGMPRDRRGYFSGIALVPAARGANELRRTYAEPLMIVMAIVGVVLLIGCANVANLLLARATARQNEMAVRLAIGASRGRLVRQLLTEGVVLVSLGAGAGLLFARWGASFLVAVLSGPAERVVLEPHFDLRVLGFTAGVSVATALLFSLAPALRATRVDAAKPGAAGGTTTHNHLGRALVVVQVTLSVLLLCGAALFLRTLHNLNRIPSGFDRDGVLTMQVEATVPGRTVPPKTPAEFRADHARLGAIWSGFIERVREVPGVSSAAVATMNPLSGWFRGVKIAIHGPVQGPEKDRGISINQVTDGYFETTGIRLLAGRLFTPRDRSGSLRVAILNETAARAFFGAESPLGRKVNFPGQRVEDELRDRRRRRRYALPGSANAGRAHGIRAAGAGDRSDHQRRRCGARARRCHTARTIDPRHRRRDRAWRVRYRNRDDGAERGDVARARADARPPRHVLCRARADPGVYRPLRRDGVPRGPTHARDRDSYRRRRQTAERRLDDGARDAAAGEHRGGARHSRLACREPLYRRPAVRRDPSRSDRDRRCSVPAGDRHDGGWLRARTPCESH